MSIVTYEKDGAVGVVTLAKPPHNLIDEAFLDALLAAYSDAVAGGCRGILLRSGMRHFCAGAAATKKTLRNSSAIWRMYRCQWSRPCTVPLSAAGSSWR